VEFHLYSISHLMEGGDRSIAGIPRSSALSSHQARRLLSSRQYENAVRRKIA